MFSRYSKFALAITLMFSLITVDISPSFWSEIKSVFNGSGKVVDLLYLASQNSNVIDNFGVTPRKAEAAEDPLESEYHIHVGPINGNVTANYVYASLMNPTGSGKTIAIKKMLVRANATTTANYVNLSVRRVVAATAGTAITGGDIPKKNSDSVNSIAEVRHTGPTPTFSGTVDSRLLGQPMPGAAGHEYSFREISFNASDEKIILAAGEGIVVYQEAGGDLDQKISATIEWEELSSPPSAQGEYMMALPRVEVAATANYVYNSIFNPAASGRAVIVKRIWFGAETCDTTAVYTNNLVVKRISAASAGTQVAVANIPKKNTGSSNSVLDVRRTGVTVTVTGGADARLLHATPCGAAGEAQGWGQYDIAAADEKIILKQGEGLALISETAGDIDQIVRMFVEWQEVAIGSIPSAQNEYIWSSNRIEAATPALGQNHYTLFNPSGSGKRMLVKRLVIKVNADTAAAYSTFNFQRVSAASGGTLITASDIPKKHSSSSNSAMQIRWCGATCGTAVTATYVGAQSTAVGGLSDSGLMKTMSPAVVGQLSGQKELVFMPGDPLVLAEGEGLGFYPNYLLGDVDNYVKIMAEWQEVTSAPTSTNKYALEIGAMPGSTSATYNYGTFFNPSGSGKAAVIKQIALRVNAMNTATYSSVQVRRISAASGGTQITAANIPKKDTTSSSSIMEIRRTGVTATYSQGADAQIIGVQTPGLSGAVTSLSKNGWRDVRFENDERIILQPGEGLVLNNNTAANVNHRLYWYIEWEEVTTANTPAPQNSHLMTVGPVNGSLTANYVYATLFNPATSTRAYVMSRVGIRADRNGTAVAPVYPTVTLRKITAASGGTVVAIADIPKQHTNSSSSEAQIRKAGATVTFDLATTSRLLNVLAPGVVRQSVGILENEIVYGDEFVLNPGEGIALYQESAAGDVLIRYQMSAMWKEVELPEVPYLTFALSDNSVGFGSLTSSFSRYATGDSLGTGTIYTTAHTIAANTNASGGYVMTVNGTTLVSSSYTIPAIGGTALTPTSGVEQFGISLGIASGSGMVSSPYSTTNQYALATSSFPDVVATGAGDSATTTYNVSYVANIKSDTPAGIFSAQLTYIVTGTY